MTDLRDILAGYLGPAAAAVEWLPGTSITERGRTFSVRLDSRCGERGVGVRLDTGRLWPGLRTCDALFLFAAGGDGHFHVLLVELKGAHVEQALGQIEAAARRLCRRQPEGKSAHDRLAAACPDLARSRPHGATVLGLVVAASGLVQAQTTRARLHKELGLRVRIGSGQCKGLALASVLRAAAAGA